MKKVLLIAAIAAFGFTNAQEVSFGAKAGVNMANLMGDVEGTDMRISFHIGGVAEIPIGQDFFFAPELLYSSQGAKSTYDESQGGMTSKGEIEWKLDYIQVPLMARYYVADSFFLEAGPQAGFLLAAKQDFEQTISGTGTPFDGTTSGSDDIKDEMSGLDYGLNIGLGYKMDNGLFFQGRYNIGLANVFDTDEDFSAQNSVIQVSVGFMF